MTRRLVIAVLATLGPLWGSPIIFSGTQGPLSASVSFEVDLFNNLRVVLTNTSVGDVLAPDGVLTAVFFNLTGDPALTALSAVVAPGSVVRFGGTDPGGGVGGEWAYSGALAGAPGGARYGLSSVGLGLFGPWGLFPGANLAGPDSPDGLQYGLTSAGDNLATGNTPVTGTEPLIQNAVVFTLGGLPPGFSLDGISSVRFLYGTDLSGPSFPGDDGGKPPSEIPEPGTLVLVLIGLGLLGVGAVRQRLAG